MDKPTLPGGLDVTALASAPPLEPTSVVDQG